MVMQVTMGNKGLSQVTHFYLREIMSHVSHSTLCDSTQRDKRKKLSHRHHYGKSYLTPREFDCVKLLLENKKMKEIAFDLGLSKRTVEFYMKNIRQRYSLRKRSEVIAYFKNIDSFKSI